MNRIDMCDDERVEAMALVRTKVRIDLKGPYGKAFLQEAYNRLKVQHELLDRFYSQPTEIIPNGARVDFANITSHCLNRFNQIEATLRAEPFYSGAITPSNLAYLEVTLEYLNRDMLARQQEVAA